MLRALEQRGLTLAAEGFLADFELAVWNAVDAVFGVPVHGCAFHWAQAIQKNYQKHGLDAAVKGNKEMWADTQALKHIQFLYSIHILDFFNRMKARHSNLDPSHPLAT